MLATLALLFYGLGGWYYSSQLVHDGFTVTGPSVSYDVELVASSGNEVTLKPVGAEDPNVARDGVFGMAWQGGGYARVGHVLGTGADGSVTRVVLDGTPPAPGSLVAIESYAYPGDPRQAFGIDFQDVTYESPLGPMPAWMVPGTRSTWVVQVHGKGASLRESLRLVQPFHQAGYPQLVIAYRNDPGVPEDPHHIYQYGRTEWEDLQGAVRYAVDHGAERVVLVGYSTGGAIAISYMLHAQPGPVAAAVLDAPNLDMGATVDYGASRRNLPLLPFHVPRSLSGVAKSFTAVRLGLNWDALDYVRRAGQVIVPVLVIHGTDDTTVPIETSRRFAAARPELVTLIEVPGAEHVGSWNIDPEAYDRDVLSFLDRALSS